jgi:PAS domain S-box-containing protein
MRTSFSLRSTIAIVLAVLAVFLTGALAVYDRTRSYRDLEQVTLRRATTLSHIVAPAVERAVLQGDLNGAEDEVARLALMPETALALVCDADHRVLCTTDFLWRNRSLYQTPAAAALPLIVRARETMTAQSEIAPDGGSVHVACPIHLDVLAGELYPSRIGVLYTQTDLAASKQRELGAIVQRTVIAGSAALAACFLIWGYLRITFTRHLDALAQGAAAYASGRGVLRVAAEGPQELAQIGRVLNQMFADLMADHAALQASEERFRQLFDGAADAIVVHDLEGRLLDVNRVACESLGYTRGELLQFTVFDIETRLTPDELVGTWKQLRALPRVSLEGVFRRRDGSEFSAEIHVVPFAHDERALFCASVQDITARKRYETQLEKARAAAEAASVAKSEFLANMSHEIRTPMNGVIGMTELLLRTELDAQQRRCLEAIHVGGKSLAALLNNILDFSQFESGKLHLEAAEFDLRLLLEELAAALRQSARNKGLKFVWVVAPEVPAKVRGDSGRLRQILTNLAGNAVKFTSQGEVVVRTHWVAETETDVTLRFAIRDTGIGISPEQQQKLFQRFSQADASSTRRFGGSGLGLAIAKELAVRMGGEIGVTSQAGSGSEFWFTVRLDKQTPGASPADVQPRWRGKRVLVADDNPINQEVALGILRHVGLCADAVADGAEAVSALTASPYDLVLMDMQMPETDGLEATRIIRDPDSAVLNHQIPIIAMTANTMSGQRERCFDAGMNGYVTEGPRAAACSINGRN